MNSTTPANHDAFRRLAWVLGLAGLLPFFAHALFAWVAPDVESGGLLRSQAHYAAAILSFLGALHWGVALASPLPFTSRDGVRLVWSVIPALLAWVIPKDRAALTTVALPQFQSIGGAVVGT